MSKLIDRWIQAHRVSRAVFVAAGLIGLLLWSLWDRPAPMVSRVTQQGQVITVVKDGITVIELPGGKRVRTFTPYPVPAQGDFLPMTVETYQDGSVLAVIDLQAWQTGSPR